LDEPLVYSPNQMQLLTLSRTLGLIYLAGGDTDNGAAITWTAQSPSFDSGDERTQKLYVDAMVDADGTGNLTSRVDFNNQTVSGPTLILACAGARAQFQENIASLAALSLYRNISLRFSATGGPDGPRVYAFEPSGFVQPYLSSFFTTQFLNLAYPGWKSHRRLYAGLISNASVLFTIKTQDNRVFGPYSIPSTAGQFRIVPMMVVHGCKDLAFAYQLDGGGQTFALFPEAFTIETKGWADPSFLPLAVLKT
jgi:hypothetical protein